MPRVWHSNARPAPRIFISYVRSLQSQSLPRWNCYLHVIVVNRIPSGNNGNFCILDSGWISVWSCLLSWINLKLEVRANQHYISLQWMKYKKFYLSKSICLFIIISCHHYDVSTTGARVWSQYHFQIILQLRLIRANRDLGACREDVEQVFVLDPVSRTITLLDGHDHLRSATFNIFVISLL